MGVDKAAGEAHKGKRLGGGNLFPAEDPQEHAGDGEGHHPQDVLGFLSNLQESPQTGQCYGSHPTSRSEPASCPDALEDKLNNFCCMV